MYSTLRQYRKITEYAAGHQLGMPSSPDPHSDDQINEVAILLLGFFLVIKGENAGMLLAAQTIAEPQRITESVIGFVQSLPEFEAGVLRLKMSLNSHRIRPFRLPTMLKASPISAA